MTADRYETEPLAPECPRCTCPSPSFVPLYTQLPSPPLIPFAPYVHPAAVTAAHSLGRRHRRANPWPPSPPVNPFAARADPVIDDSSCARITRARPRRSVPSPPPFQFNIAREPPPFTLSIRRGSLPRRPLCAAPFLTSFEDPQIHRRPDVGTATVRVMIRHRSVPVAAVVRVQIRR